MFFFLFLSSISKLFSTIHLVVRFWGNICQSGSAGCHLTLGNNENWLATIAAYNALDLYHTTRGQLFFLIAQYTGYWYWTVSIAVMYIFLYVPVVAIISSNSAKSSMFRRCALFSVVCRVEQATSAVWLLPTCLHAYLFVILIMLRMDLFQMSPESKKKVFLWIIIYPFESLHMWSELCANCEKLGTWPGNVLFYWCTRRNAHALFASISGLCICKWVLFAKLISNLA